MRNVIAVCVTIILPMTLVLLMTVPQETQCVNPMAVAKVAMSVLGPLVQGYLAKLSAKRKAESIHITVWMHNGDVKLNGCGLYFKAIGYSGGTGSTYFPKEAVHRCTTAEYEMRMTSQSAMYDGTVHLGNEQAKDLVLAADGFHDTFVNVLCIGLSERTIAGGPRAFCLNNDILKACKDYKNAWNDIDLQTNDIKMTKTNRGIYRIVLSDIERLINGFERLNNNPDDESAVSAICDRIDLVKGTANSDNWNCSAKRTWIELIGYEFALAALRRYENEDKNPYGCNRFTNRRR